MVQERVFLLAPGGPKQLLDIGDGPFSSTRESREGTGVGLRGNSEDLCLVLRFKGRPEPQNPGSWGRLGKEDMEEGDWG